MKIIKLLIITITITSHLMAAEVMTLPNVINQAETNGFKLKIEQMKLRQSGAKIWQQWSKVFPQVSARLEKVHNDLKGTRQLSSSVSLDSSDDSLNLEPIDAQRMRLSIQQLLYDPKFPKQVKLAELELIMATHTYDQAKLDQRLDLTNTYFEMASLQERRALSKHEEGVLDAHLTEIKNKKALNHHTQEDVLKVEVELNNIKQNTLKINQNLRLAIAKLNHSMGNHSKDALMIDTSTLEPVLYLDIADSLGALETAWDKRPDVQIIKTELQHLKLQQQMLDANMLPIITLSVDYGSADSSKFSFSKSDRDYSWNLGGSINLFDGLETPFKKEEVNAQIDQKKFELKFKKLELQSEINDALYQLQIAQQILKDSETELNYAQEKLNSSKKKYENKLITQLDLFYAEKFYHETKTKKAIARLELAKAAAVFKVALGKTPSKI